MKWFFKYLLEYSVLKIIYDAWNNFDKAAGGVIYNPKSLKELDKADAYLKKYYSYNTKI